MQDTTRRLVRVLGGSNLEAIGSDARFVVDSADGSQLRVAVQERQQRVLATLLDGAGKVRADLDIGPVGKATEDNKSPGRVTLHAKGLKFHLDSTPVVAITVAEDDAG